MTRDEFAKTLDMTVLKPEAGKDAILRLCEQAWAARPAAVCIYPTWIRTARKALEGSGVLVCTVIGFPHGCATRKVKVFEAQEAVQAGAREVDMVVNLGALKTGDWSVVEAEVRDVAEASRLAGLEAGDGPVITKVIIECAALTDEEKVRAATICRDVAADFVKTSTGFGPGGATVEDVRLLRETVGPGLGVKAAGGIRTLESALAMLEAGATRIGTSSGLELVEAFRSARAG